MAIQDITQDLATVAKESRYPLAAFLFVQRGLDFTVNRIHGELEDDQLVFTPQPPNRHVDARQLCEGLRDYAIQQYGLLARCVLRRWNILTCEDFGQIVFAMVEGGLMHKTAEDDFDDFRGQFRFADAFAPDLELAENL